MEEIKDILYSKNYSINVDVKINHNLYYSAKLNITHSGVFLYIYGEFQNRQQMIDSQLILEERVDLMVCYNSRYVFKLYGLTGNDYEVRNISQRSGERESFYSNFKINYFYLYHKSATYSAEKFQALSIYSPDIDKWLGVTKKQLDIYKHIGKHGVKDSNSSLCNEFLVDLDKNSDLAINYRHSVCNDTDNFQVVRRFAPLLNIRFKDHLPIEDVTKYYKEVINIFYVLIGIKIEISKVFITTTDGRKQLPYYYHENRQINKKDSGDFYFRYDSASPFYDKNRKKFPLEIFNHFFLLDEGKKELFRKFAYYDSLQILEEQFLGFFRILETLTFAEGQYFDEEMLNEKLDNLKEELCKSEVKRKTVKKFIKRIQSLNNQKHNTSHLIRRYIKTLPKGVGFTLDHWDVEIEEITKLRNDLSHGNYVSISDDKLKKYTLFIKFLSLHSLWDLIELTDDELKIHSEFRQVFKVLE